MTSRVVTAWLFFFVGLGIESGVDFLWRSSDGDIHTGGFPRSIWFGVHAVLAAAAIAYVCSGPRRDGRVGSRILFWSLQVAVAIVLYLLVCAMYGIGTGIDVL